MSAPAFDLNQLHDDLLVQLELGFRRLDATELFADGGEAQRLFGELIEAMTDFESALSAALRDEKGLAEADERAGRAAKGGSYDAQEEP